MSELKELFCRRAAQVALIHGKPFSVPSAYVPSAYGLKWIHNLADGSSIHVVMWGGRMVNARFTGPPGFSRHIYSVYKTAIGEDEKFNPELARAALAVFDRYMILDDLSDA